ncbi:MAG: HDOD domain-containing protein [bacterium]|nr:HDOD domain-containing protein [bacterium]
MGERFTILFVDDEEKVLSGLRRMLRPMRQEWDMHFALSAEAALELLDCIVPEVIVSDVRIPGTDGIELLDIIRKRYPGMVRIILSGHSDQVATLRATGVAHQYLAKPCESATLQTAIERSVALRRELGDPDLAAAIAGTKTLPPAPQAYKELTRELAKEDPSLHVVAQIVSKDPALAAKILQLVNSAFFALRREVTSIDQAVALLGMTTVAGLTLTVGLFDTRQPDPKVAAVLDEIRERSLAAASVAKSVAIAEGGSAADGDAAFLSGILHDCGKLVVALNWPEAFIQVENTATTLVSERSRYGIDHCHAGAYLLGVWGLPDEIVEAVAYHHHPTEGASGDSFGPTGALHVALAMMDRHRGSSHCPLDEDYIDSLGKADRIDAWADLVENYEYERANA